MNKAKKVIKCTHCHLMKGISWISFMYTWRLNLSREKDQMSSSWEFKSRSVLWKQKKRISVKENYGKLGESETLFPSSISSLLMHARRSALVSCSIIIEMRNKKKDESKKAELQWYIHAYVCFYVHSNLFRMIIILFVNSHKALSSTKYCQQLWMSRKWILLNTWQYN